MAAENTEDLPSLRIDKLFMSKTDDVAIIAEINRRARAGQLPVEDGRINIGEFITFKNKSGKTIPLGMTILQLATSKARWLVVQHFVNECLGRAGGQAELADKSRKNVLDKQAKQKNVQGYTLLMFALEGLCKLVGQIKTADDWETYQNDIEACKALIITLVVSGYVDVNITSEQSSGRHHPLHRAAQAGFPDIVKLLLRHGGEALYSNVNGQTPMQVAMEKLNETHPNSRHREAILAIFTEAQKPNNIYQKAYRAKLDELANIKNEQRRQAPPPPQPPAAPIQIVTEDPDAQPAKTETSDHPLTTTSAAETTVTSTTSENAQAIATNKVTQAPKLQPTPTEATATEKGDADEPSLAEALAHSHPATTTRPATTTTTKPIDKQTTHSNFYTYLGMAAGVTLITAAAVVLYWLKPSTTGPHPNTTGNDAAVTARNAVMKQSP